MDIGEPLRITRRFVVPAGELTERFSRASGPGGQGVNTTDSRVELSFDVARSRAVPDHLRDRLMTRLAPRLVDGRITVTVAEERRQLVNRLIARDRLAALLAEAVAAPPRSRRATRPTRGSAERRLAAKKRRGDLKKGRGRIRD